MTRVKHLSVLDDCIRGGGVLDDDALAGKPSVETECRSVQSNRIEVEAAHRSLGSIAVFPVQEN